MREQLKKALDFTCDYWIEILQSLFAGLILFGTTVLSDEGCEGAYCWLVEDFRSTDEKLVLFQNRKSTIQRLSLWIVLAGGAAEFILAIFAGRSSLRKSHLEKHRSELMAENEVLVENIHNLLEGYLLNFAMYRLDFGKDSTNNERITLYVHDSTKNMFVPAARYSQDPHLKKNGRDRYPESDGCIGHAWRHGEDSLQIKDGPSSRKYAEQQERKGISEHVLCGFKMKSRFYFASRIDRIEASEPLAVLVIESTEHDRFDVKHLREMLEDEVRRNLAELVTRVRPYLSVPSDAAGRGF